MSSKTIVLADNQDITRLGLQHIIESQYGDFNVIKADNKHTLESFLEKDNDAVVIIDPYTFDIKPIDDVLSLARIYDKSHWLVFSHEISDSATRSFSALQNISILLKDCYIDEITSGILLAKSHQRFICHRLMDVLLNNERPDDSPLAELSATEKEILRLTALGKSVKEIANERNSSVHTITTHKRNIFRKINVNTSYEATMVAVKAGLVNLIEYYI